MNHREHACVFSCGDADLIGVASLPEAAGPLGVVVVVGGPQYRVGSHRQFTLLARALAVRGIPVLRFDYRGMGDAEGPAQTFDAVDDDLRRAVDTLMGLVPGLRGVVLWGLCDAASAAMIYAGSDPRVQGLVLLNPWVRDGQTQATAQVKHYYAQRFLDKAFWKRLAGGEVSIPDAIGGLVRALWRMFSGRRRAGAAGPRSFQDRMLAGWRAFTGPSLLILSGNDLTAKEFLEYCQARPAWGGMLADRRLQREDMPEADHTFSTRAWRDRVAALTADWIDQLRPASADQAGRVAGR